jgi:DNA polymerase III alpha subunit
MPDIDIDFADRNKILDILPHIPASIRENNIVKKHNTGVYFQEIPYDPFTDTANIDYKEAEDRGYFKIDFLNVSVYKDIRNEEHLNDLMNREPLWELLEQRDFVDLLFHLNGHSSILAQTKPKTVEQLAAVLAMIRPAKRYLVGETWDRILSEVWQRPNNDEYYFKKSHSIAYAVLIVVQMNLLCESISYEFS